MSPGANTPGVSEISAVPAGTVISLRGPTRSTTPSRTSTAASDKSDASGSTSNASAVNSVTSSVGTSQEVLEPIGLGSAQRFAGCASFDDHAVIHEHGLIADVAGETDLMGDDH